MIADNYWREENGQEHQEEQAGHGDIITHTRQMVLLTPEGDGRLLGTFHIFTVFVGSILRITMAEEDKNLTKIIRNESF